MADSTIDKALTAYKEDLLAKTVEAENAYETAKAKAASQNELIRVETERLEKLKEDNATTLATISQKQHDVEQAELALSAKAAELRKQEEANTATSNALILREQTIKQAEDKLAEERNVFESSKAEHVTVAAGLTEKANAVAQEAERIKALHEDLDVKLQTLKEKETQLQGYALELSGREDEVTKTKTTLIAREDDLKKQEGLHADMGKMFADKKDQLKAIEESLITRTKDLDDREAGIKAAEEALAKREAKVKAKEVKE